MSFDDSDLDDEVASELSRYSNRELLRRRAERLELVWKVGKRRKPVPCDCCDGSGEKPCSWCNATGAMRIGEHVFCSLETGCKPCPVCNSKGAVKCSHCKGTGFRAGWLEPGCPTAD
ncbi:hypothetical protein WJX81_006767 [Elliptochloris bilobata]|uniref:Uncharacterized protein n=1 Tax=Elliptochloris bilobata TaxID=381761 RepID=A0AAW1SBE8_9CHLO